MVGGRRFATALLGAAAALILAAAPWNIGVNGFSTHAAAGQEQSSGSGKANAGNGSDKAGKSNSGKSDSGKSSAARGKSDTVYPADAQQAGGAGLRLKASEFFNPATGAMIEVDGSNVAVLHPDGILEKIVNDLYSLNDAQGRLIIERTSTDSDRERFRMMLAR